MKPKKELKIVVVKGHPDEKKDKEMLKKMVKKSALKSGDKKDKMG